MGFSLRIVPGVRLRVSSRGVSASMGPRIARVSVGTSGMGVSSGIGPVTLSGGGSYRAALGLAGMQHRRAQSRSPSASALAAQQRAARQLVRKQERQAQVVAAQRAIDHVLTLHEQEFEPISKPSMEDRDPAEAAQIEEWWDALLTGDPETVFETVNHALSDNERPSAAVAVDGEELSVVILAPTLEEIPDRTVVVSPAGTLTTRVVSATKRNSLHAAALAGYAAATIKESLAVAPSINHVRIVAVTRSDDGGWGILLTGAYDRGYVRDIDWTSDRFLLAMLDIAQIRTAGKTGELLPIDLEHEPDLQALLRQLGEADSGPA